MNAGDLSDELFNNVACALGCDVTTGTAISVTAGSVRPGMDFALAPKAALDVSAATGTSGGTASLSATLSSMGAPLSGRMVTFALSGVPVGSAMTNAAGVARLVDVSLAGVNAGTYPGGVQASFAGEVAYASTSGSGTLTVAPAPDTTAPTIVIATPAHGATYTFGQDVAALFSCTDEGGLADCVGTVPNGSPIDTFTPGVFTFTVMAHDRAGNAVMSAATYTVLGVPTISVMSPREPLYELGQMVLAAYVCIDAASCVGDVANGAAIDTSTPGVKSFAIVATDALGNETVQIVSYTVSTGAALAPMAGVTAWLGGDGSPRDEVTSADAAWTGPPTYVAGKVSQAFAVGTGQSVAFSLVQTGPFTVQAWVRAADPLQPEFAGVLATGTAPATTVQLDLDGAGTYRLVVGDHELSLLVGPATALFQHVAVTFDGVMLSVYLNGLLVQSESWTGSPDLGVEQILIGLDRRGLHAFTGAVDEVQVFNRALSETEVGEVFAAGASGMRKGQGPVVVAVATPTPAEATGPAGALVTLDGTASSDPDFDVLTYVWREGTTILGTTSVLPVLLSIGSHAITLTVDDGHFRTASTDVVVVVADTAAPVLNGVPGDLTLEATGLSGAIALWAVQTALDVVDGVVPVTCVPESGTTFALGTTVVMCTATDLRSHEGHGTFSVTVRDTAAPVVSVPSAITTESTSAVGAVVSFTATAIDAVDGVVAVTCTPLSGTVFPLGTTPVSCVATDVAGNTGHGTFDVTVRDTTPPVLSSVPGDMVIEATGPTGAVVAWTSPTATDVVDGLVPVTCVPASGSTFALGTTSVTCAATDVTGNTGQGTFAVTVRDTTAPAMTLPGPVVAEATSPAGAVVAYVASAMDLVSGVVPVLCAPAPGSLFPIGTTPVTCVASDALGHTAPGGFTVVVRDTTAPGVQPTLPSPDAMLVGATVEVVASASDVVGVTSATANGVASMRTAGPVQAGTWRATVPLALPVLPGGVLRFDTVGSDAAGNAGTSTLLVDNDGIPTALDRHRTTGVDQSGFHSNDFNNRVTAGTLTRNGWTPLLSNAPTAGGVRVRLSGAGAAAGAAARISLCTGAAKDVRLDAVGETADVTCAGNTITVRAVSTLGTIEVLKQQATGTWTMAQLPSGASYSTGSPATASPDNTAPIVVRVLRGASPQSAQAIGSFRLAPGDSVDVAMVPATAGGDEQLRFTALRGRVALTYGGATRTLRPGRSETVPLGRLAPRVSCASPDDRWHGDNVELACVALGGLAELASAREARFTLRTTVAEDVETAAATTETREVCDGDGHCAEVEGIAGNRVDRKAPTITITGPAAGTTYLLRQAVPAAFQCADDGSGVAACEGTSARGQALPTNTVGAAAFEVISTDAVGHVRTAAVPYDVTYAIVPLGTVLVDGPRGTPMPIRLQIADAQGVNHSAAAIPVTAQALIADTTGIRVALDAPFRFDAQLRAYTLDLEIARLEPGAYSVSFVVLGDPVVHTVAVRVR